MGISNLVKNTDYNIINQSKFFVEDYFIKQNISVIQIFSVNRAFFNLNISIIFQVFKDLQEVKGYTNIANQFEAQKDYFGTWMLTTHTLLLKLESFI